MKSDAHVQNNALTQYNNVVKIQFFKRVPYITKMAI